jgi:GntR family transcriptional regulator, transcriptional repressor for pyruvate dehydrogenase complex
MTDPVRPPKVAEAVAGRIEKLIFTGVLRPGEKLASERSLAEKLEVSRPSLREALELLSERGLVTSTRGGTIVAQFLAPLIRPLASILQDNPRGTDDYFEFRHIIEPQAARLAATRATNIDRRAIRGCVEQMANAHKLEDPTQEAETDVEFHLLIYEASHNSVMLHVMRALSELLRQGIFYSRQQLYLHAGARQKLLEQHYAIVEAIIEGKPKEAETAAREHIRFTSETVSELRSDSLRLETSLSRVGRNEFLAR